LLVNQLFLYAAVYVLMLPLCLAIFSAGLLPWRVFGLFFLILIVEHLSYEAYRLFISLERPLTGSTVSFIRGASWVLLLPVLFLWREDLQTLNTVLLMWLFGGLLSLLFSALMIVRTGWSFAGVSLDVRWIRRGLNIALPFLLGTLAIRSIFALDRYFIEAMSTLAMVGVYTFYIGMCVAMQGLMDAAIFSFAYPRMIAAASAGDEEGFWQLFWRVAGHTLVATAVLVVAIYWLSAPLIRLVDNPVYLDYLYLLKHLLAAFSVFLFSMVPHFGLYAMHSDSAIIIGNVLALLAFLAAAAALYAYQPALTVIPDAMIIAFSLMFLFKSIRLYYVSRAFFTRSRANAARTGP